MKNYSSITLLFVCFFSFWSCQSENKTITDKSTTSATTPEEKTAEQSTLDDATGWTVLFDGISGANWRGYGKENFPSEGWTAINGALTLLDKSDSGDIITKEQYENFDFRVEFKLAKGANSGILYLVQELEGKPSYYSAPEYQLIDDVYIIEESKGDESVVKHHLTADNYDLQTAMNKNLNPAGQWNSARIVVNKGHVEHYLNGVKVVEYELWTPEWEAMVAKSKFNEWKEYGQAKKGHIGLQNHGDSVSFRNIRIKPL